MYFDCIYLCLNINLSIATSSIFADGRLLIIFSFFEFLISFHFISFYLGCENCFQSSTVTSLDLSKNPTFGDKGLKNFLLSYKMSNKFYHLRSLNLRNIGLDGNLIKSNNSSGLYELFQFLSLSNCQITELDLSENYLLGDEGAKMIFTSLLTNNTLEKLNLAETKLSTRNSLTHIAAFLINNKVFDLNFSLYFFLIFFCIIVFFAT